MKLLRRIASSVLAAAVLVPGTSLAANVIAGQRIYSQHCIGCHGPGGHSALPNAPHFSRGERLMQPDMMLLATIKAGKMTMPSFNGILRDQEILDVIAYLRTLQR